MKVISGSSNQPLADSIAQKLGLELVTTQLSEFANGEKRVLIVDEVRGKNVVLIQSFSEPVDEHIIETLLMIDALERMGARHINLLIPWLGYSLQDKVFRPGEPIATKMVANLMSQSYAKRAYLLDLHNTSIPGFFAIPTHHLTAQDLFLDYIRQNFNGKAVVASPDFGGLKRARVFADQLKLELVNIDKTRDLETGQVTAMSLHGNVKNRVVFLLDDVILSGSTAIKAAQVIKEAGAKEVHFLSTHALFTNDSLKKLTASELDSIVTTNSVNHRNLPKKIKVLDCASVFTEPLKVWIWFSTEHNQPI